jgi:monofunctional biosynthetic peptidoglycan transglycosylase
VLKAARSRKQPRHPRRPRTRASARASDPGERRSGAGRLARPKRPRGGGFLRVTGAAVLCLGAWALALYLQLPSTGSLRTHHPASTAIIDARAQEARAKGRAARRIQQWVPLSHISPWLQDAVVDSEDARFYFHHGIDTVEFNRALQKAMDEGKLGRGASTLTQQLAKNLWLGEERSLFRKAKEYLLARRLERLGKDRILELYLNEVEWGEGIYGAEAAARTWFHKPAAALSPEEAAVLTAMLPAPRKRNPRRPSPHLRARAYQVLHLYGVYNQLEPRQLHEARERLRALIGPP